jgi:hypothetical protein
MTSLKRIFFSPRNLLYFPSLSSARKRELLRKWQDERMRYIFETGRDYDFMLDKEIDDLQSSVNIVKAIVVAEEENAVRISLVQRTIEEKKK